MIVLLHEVASGSRVGCGRRIGSRGPDHDLLVCARRGRIPTSDIEQSGGRIIRGAQVDDLADNNAVVTCPVHVPHLALEMGQRAGNEDAAVRAAFVGHAAMWLSVFGGVGIIIGLVVSTVLFRRRRAAARSAQSTAPDDDAANRSR